MAELSGRRHIRLLMEDFKAMIEDGTIYANALGMAIADREFYDLSILRAVHIHANIKPKKKNQK